MSSKYVRNKVTGEIKKIMGTELLDYTPKDPGKETEWEKSSEDKFKAYKVRPNKYTPKAKPNNEQDRNEEG